MRDHDKADRARGVDDIALVNQPDTGPPGQRRFDGGVIELDLGSVDIRVVCVHGGHELLYQSALRIDLLLRTAKWRFLEPLKVDPCVGKLRFVLFLGRLCQCKRRLERARPGRGWSDGR